MSAEAIVRTLTLNIDPASEAKLKEVIDGLSVFMTGSLNTNGGNSGNTGGGSAPSNPDTPTAPTIDFTSILTSI